MKSLNRLIMYVVGMLFSIVTLSFAATIQYNKSNNSIEILNEITIQENSKPHDRTLIIITPEVPYNNVTFVISMPTMVQVNQPFVIEYTLKVNKASNIPFWADLIPDPAQLSARGLSLINVIDPSIGTFDPNAPSVAHKGGKGIWHFPQGLPARSVHHLTVTLKATTAGAKQFITMLATNPPLLVGPIAAFACAKPAQPHEDTAYICKSDPIVISVLDNDNSCVPLTIAHVTQPAHGAVLINNDNTITYYPDFGFVGSDTISYTVKDALGNEAMGTVNVYILECTTRILN